MSKLKMSEYKNPAFTLAAIDAAALLGTIVYFKNKNKELNKKVDDLQAEVKKMEKWMNTGDSSKLKEIEKRLKYLEQGRKNRKVSSSEDEDNDDEDVEYAISAMKNK